MESGEAARGWKRGAPALIAVGSALLFIALAAWSLESPGLHYDEALFVNGALGGVTDSFVHRRVFGIPVLLMPYMGALKSYLFAPVFALLGVSIETIRAPAVLLGAMCVLLGYKVGQQVSGSRWIGALFTLTMATDPIFVFLGRTDFGPIVPMILIKFAALIALLKLLNTQESLCAWAVAILLILGMFDKLNFIWIVAALLLSAAIVYRKECVRLFRKREASFLMAVAFLLLGLTVAGILIVPLMSNGQVDPIDWAGRLDQARILYELTMNAQAINQMMLGAPVMPSSPADKMEKLILVVLILIVVLRFAAPGIHVRRTTEGNLEPSPSERRRSNLAFLVILFGLILLQVLLTRQATGPHHIMTLWPFHHLIMLQAIVVLMDSLRDRFLILRSRFYIARAAGSVFIGLAVLGVAFSQLNVTRAYNAAFDAAPRLPPMWTRSIYPLAAYVFQAPEADAVICVDWGICNQVLALSSRMRAKNQDLWSAFADLDKRGDPQEIFDHYFKGRRTIVITHVGEAVMMPAAHENFTRFAEHYLGNPAPSKLVVDGEGGPVFAVYEMGR